MIRSLMKTGYKYEASGVLVTLNCGVCGVLFAMPEQVYDRCQRDHGNEFWCCNGHALHFLGRTEAEKLRESLEHARKRAGRLAAERDQVTASLRAQRGVTTKLRKRIAAGVCPECNRSFKNLHQHMAGQHPEFVSGEVE